MRHRHFVICVRFVSVLLLIVHSISNYEQSTSARIKKVCIFEVVIYILQGNTEL